MVQVGPAEFFVLVADTPEERARGLSGRPSLPRDWGMWFDLGRSTVPSFWMKDMRFPQDMVWIDAGLQVVGVTHEAQVPEPGTPEQELPRYNAGSTPVRYVLEINGGLARELGIAPGQPVRPLGVTSGSGG